MREHHEASMPAFSTIPIKGRAVSPEIGFSSPDRKARGKSIDCQSIERADPAIRARIRRAIVSDKGLSLSAQNVEISVGPGGITLFGSVKSQEERNRIESDAAAVVKVGRVLSKLVVRPSQELCETRPRQPHEPNEQPDTEQECDRIRRQWGIRGKSKF